MQLQPNKVTLNDNLWSPFPSDDSFDFLDLIFPEISDVKNDRSFVVPHPDKRVVAEILEIKLDDKIKS